MKHFRIALAGISTLVLVVAILVACTSSDEQSQEQQAEGTSSTTQTTEADEQTTRATPAQQDEQSTTADQSSDSSTSESAQSGSSDQQEQQSTVAATADQQDQEAQARPTQDADSGQTDQGQATQDESDTDEQEAQQTADAQQDQPQSADSDDQQDQAVQDNADQPAEDDQQQAEPMRPEQQEQQELQQEEEPSQAERERERLRLRAEEISAQATVSDLVGLNGWLNGEETSVALELAKGNIVLVDFWTYTCINCVRTLPFLTAWDEKYRDHGLVIIGVHTPEFEFEERFENVQEAIDEHGIEYLVAIDNDYRTWRALQGSRGFWPRKFLIGPTPDGSPMGTRYDHIGEGDYEETEVAIRAALEAIGRDLSDVPFGVNVSVPDRGGVAYGRQTRELYAGWSRNNGRGGPYAGQDEYFLSGTGVNIRYTDVDRSDREHNRWYLQGLWSTYRESITHARETDDLEDYIALLVRGRTANVVLTVAEDGSPYNVYVELDGRWLLPSEAGSHIQWDEKGRSFFRVNQNDLYRLIFLPEWKEVELKLRSDSDQFRIFAFTFGSYVGGE